jgi:outer membrane receptor protein involved in Fe transport
MLAMSAVSLLGIVHADAQATGDNLSAAQTNSPGVEQVTVTGTRISIQGYEQPTPVTVVSSEDLERDSYADIAQSLVEMPSVGISQTLTNSANAPALSTGDAGMSTVNLRNLGGDRTLILFDGQRVGIDNLQDGVVDLDLLPSELIQRVDVVTGGASAAYGSDAVAGVVNLILNKSFTGLKAYAQFGDSTTVQERQTKVAATYGADFAGGKGHFIVSGDHTWSPDSPYVGQANWFTNATIVQNPAATSSNGLPYYISARNVGEPEFTQGGVVNGNTAGGTGSSLSANSLKGLQFVGNGIVEPFNYGTLDAVNPNICYAGCSSNAQDTTNATDQLAVPYHVTHGFGYFSYNLTSDIQASVQLNYAAFNEHNTGTPRTNNYSVYADNAFLPQSIASQFGTLSNGYNTTTGLGGSSAQPAQSITVGTLNNNNAPAGDYNITDICSEVAFPCLKIWRVLNRGVFTLQGALGNDWSWNVYAEGSQMRQVLTAAQDNYGPNYNFAIDAVKVTPTNVGASGLAIGSIQCRAVLQGNPAAAGCVPLDILGNGVATPEAILYQNPGNNPSSGIFNRELITYNQYVYSGSMQGKLPWGLPAGNVAVAFGAEYRHEQGSQSQIQPVDVTVKPYPGGNFSPYSGQYEVEEGFLEADIPVLKNEIVEDLSANAAGRITDYSTSGLVETWKLGLTSQVDENIKLRGTWSLDIRAPLISELFSPLNTNIGLLQYPLNGPNYQINQPTGGNPNLQPEKAVTTSFGVVLTPQFIPGLTMSLDWYNINIHGGIYSVSGQTEATRCLQGQTVYCQFLKFEPSFQNGTVPYEVDSVFANAAEIKTSGLDVSANYVMELFDGQILWALRGNYTDEFTQNEIGITYDQAGCTGPTPLSYACDDIPKLRGIFSGTYSQGPWSGTIQTRFFGAQVLTNGPENLPSSVARASLSSTGVLTQGVVPGSEIAGNDVNPVAYLDLRGSYQWSPNIQLYGAIDNVTDVPRPAYGSNEVYDILGRVWRVGVRFND